MLNDGTYLPLSCEYTSNGVPLISNRDLENRGLYSILAAQAWVIRDEIAHPKIYVYQYGDAFAELYILSRSKYYGPLDAVSMPMYITRKIQDVRMFRFKTTRAVKEYRYVIMQDENTITIRDSFIDYEPLMRFYYSDMVTRPMDGIEKQKHLWLPEMYKKAKVPLFIGVANYIEPYMVCVYEDRMEVCDVRGLDEYEMVKMLSLDYRSCTLDEYLRIIPNYGIKD